MKQPELGMLVTARAGRDRGKPFLILGRIDDNHVWIADGDSRKASKPKKKKLMHLHIEPYGADALGAKLAGGESLSDAEIRKAITQLMQQRQD